MMLFSVTLGDPNYPKTTIFPFKNRHCKKMAEQVELVFGTESSLSLSYTVLEGNSVPPKLSVRLSITFTKILDLEISHLHVNRLRCCQLRWTVNMIN